MSLDEDAGTSSVFRNGLACSWDRGGVDPRSEETPRKVEEGDGRLASLETISSLVTQPLRTVQEGRRVDDTPLPEGELGPLSAVSPGPGTGIGPR